MNLTNFPILASLLVVGFIQFQVSAQQANEQKPLSISVGINMAPYGSYSFRKEFDAGVLVLAASAFTINKTGTTLISVVVLNSTAGGLIVSQQICEKLSVYALLNKKFLTDGGYTGFGFATPVTQGVLSSILFLEFGSVWGVQEFTATLSVGALIPLRVKIK